MISAGILGAVLTSLLCPLGILEAKRTYNPFWLVLSLGAVIVLAGICGIALPTSTPTVWQSSVRPLGLLVVSPVIAVGLVVIALGASLLLLFETSLPLEGDQEVPDPTR